MRSSAFGIAISGLFLLAPISAIAEESGRYTVYSQAIAIGGGPPDVALKGVAPEAMTLMVDTVTGRTWQLVATKTGIKWQPILVNPVPMSSLGTPLMGGSIVPDMPK